MANILNCGIVSSNYSIYMISICIYTYTYLVGGLEHEFYFAIYWEVHNQLTNSIIFQRGRLNHQPDMYQKPQFSIYISIFFFKTWPPYDILWLFNIAMERSTILKNGKPR